MVEERDREEAERGEVDALRGEVDALRGEVDALRVENQQLRALAGVGPGEEALGVPFRALFEGLPLAVVAYRSDGRAIAASARFLELAGASREEICSRSLLQDPAARDAGRAASFERALRGETASMPPASAVAAGLPAGGETWVETTFAPLGAEGGDRYVIEVHLDITEQRRAERAVRERADLFEAILDASPVLIFAKDRGGRYLFVNRGCLDLLGLQWDLMKGRTDHEVFPKALADDYVASDQKAISRKAMDEREEHLQVRDGYHDFVTAKFPLLDSSGEVWAVCSSSTDVTRLKRAEGENRRLQEEIIRAQEVTLRALSTPLLPIARGVVVMPLIGTLDRARADRVLETLLDGIVANQAGKVILDITGVPDVDADVAEALCRTARAVRLLGAAVILTGVQPRIARTLVEIGGDLGDIVHEGTLESGIARALRR